LTVRVKSEEEVLFFRIIAAAKHHIAHVSKIQFPLWLTVTASWS